MYMVLVEYISRILTKIKILFHRMFNWKLYYGVKLHGIPKLLHRQNIKLKKGVNLNEGVFLHGAGGIEIGENSTLSYGTTILSTKHLIEDWKKKANKANHFNRKVTIGKNVWICANVTILDGVEIADGVIIAAGSLVNKSLKKSNSLYGGVPAKHIKHI